MRVNANDEFCWKRKVSYKLLALHVVGVGDAGLNILSQGEVAWSRGDDLIHGVICESVVLETDR